MLSSSLPCGKYDTNEEHFWMNCSASTEDNLKKWYLSGYFTWLFMHLHDNFLPGWIVGDVVDPLLLLWHPLRSFHNFLEHCSLPERRESCQIFSKVLNHHLAIKVLMLNSRHSLLEVEGEISGNNANFKQMLHRLKLTLLKVLEDIQFLWTTATEWGQTAAKISVSPDQKNHAHRFLSISHQNYC